MFSAIMIEIFIFIDPEIDCKIFKLASNSFHRLDNNLPTTVSVRQYVSTSSKPAKK